MENVGYVPDLATNLLSVRKIAEKGTTLVYDNSGCRMFKSKTVKITGDLQGTASQLNGLYGLDVQSNNVQNSEGPKETVGLSTLHSNSQELWYRRLGHLGHKNVQLVKQLVDRVNFSTQKFKPCLACVEGKMCRQQFKPRSVGEYTTEKVRFST